MTRNEQEHASETMIATVESAQIGTWTLEALVEGVETIELVVFGNADLDARRRAARNSLCVEIERRRKADDSLTAQIRSIRKTVKARLSA